MPTVEKFAPGSFCWAELATNDVPRARAFYGELLGWKSSESPLPQGGVYTTVTRDGRSVGALFPMGNQFPAGTPPHWALYVAVANVDESTRTAQAHGAQVLAAPFEVMQYGRMSTLKDPTGGILSLWQPRQHHGFELQGEEGAPCWFELLTRDATRACDFYGKLFGWTFKVSPEYSEIVHQGRSVGGIMTMRPEMHFPPAWSTYFQVGDINSSTDRVKRLGGQVMMGPQSIPHVGSFSVVADPTGGMFYLFQLAPPNGQ